MFYPTPRDISRSFHDNPEGRSRKAQSLYSVHAPSGDAAQNIARGCKLNYYEWIKLEETNIFSYNEI
jgi:hypothetical protein